MFFLKLKYYIQLNLSTKTVANRTLNQFTSFKIKKYLKCYLKSYQNNGV